MEPQACSMPAEGGERSWVAMCLGRVGGAWACQLEPGEQRKKNASSAQIHVIYMHVHVPSYMYFNSREAYSVKDESVLDVLVRG